MQRNFWFYTEVNMKHANAIALDIVAKIVTYTSLIVGIYYFSYYNLIHIILKWAG